MAKIKTFEEACKALNILPEALPDVKTLPGKHLKAVTAFYKLTIIAEALNEGWAPDWSDHNQVKYYPWFDVVKDKKGISGFGLSYHVYDGWCSATFLGSRLCFKNRELAEYAGKKFKKLYEEFMLI